MMKRFFFLSITMVVFLGAAVQADVKPLSLGTTAPDGSILCKSVTSLAKKLVAVLKNKTTIDEVQNTEYKVACSLDETVLLNATSYDIVSLLALGFRNPTLQVMDLPGVFKSKEQHRAALLAFQRGLELAVRASYTGDLKLEPLGFLGMGDVNMFTSNLVSGTVPASDINKYTMCAWGNDPQSKEKFKNLGFTMKNCNPMQIFNHLGKREATLALLMPVFAGQIFSGQNTGYTPVHLVKNFNVSEQTAVVAARAPYWSTLSPKQQNDVKETLISHIRKTQTNLDRARGEAITEMMSTANKAQPLQTVEMAEKDMAAWRATFDRASAKDGTLNQEFRTRVVEWIKTHP